MTKDKFFLLSLGCPKNEVDAECMSSLLKNGGYRFVTDPREADFLIVNTCAFIESAKREAIDAILDLAAVKAEIAETGRNAFLIVSGCLPQRYAKEIAEELPEVDAIVGTAEFHRIVPVCERLKAEGAWLWDVPPRGSTLEHLKRGHSPSPDQAFAWLKIAEGCSNACAFCAIPGIRGRMISRPAEEIVEEAKAFARSGFRELIVVAQDTTRYGQDLYGKPSLTALLSELVKIDGISCLRLMYVYGDVFSDELIELMKNEEKILPYLDIPIQHASNSVLAAMRRRDTKESLRSLIHKLREAMPELILRTTVMVGFPGERDEDFRELLEFMREIRFDRLGCFIYSPEEGTVAAKMPQQVPLQIAEDRQKKVMELQRAISAEANQRRIGSVTEVLLEGIRADGLAFTGRSYGEAPDIDPAIHVLAQTPDLKIGDFVPCRIVNADEYELTAVSVESNEVLL